MDIDPRELRNCLGHFTTGVTVVTCDVDGSPHGATVNAFSAVSLDPPLVLVSLDRRSKAARYLDGRPFTVNVLRSQQDALALHFAGRPMPDAVPWAEPAHGSPRLADCLAHLSCRPWASYDGGDHVLHLGHVEELTYGGGAPLVFFRGQFRHLGPAFEAAPWLESGDCPGSLSRLIGGLTEAAH
ncbi:flavin reductase family protein [Saccharopolyspora hirsuta]|uniref:flavin reductase family protein n=1 Tax=Saccharopolyspora hirsuta TaxID=1837 RepID=UPI001BAB184B|nr:flavin reductase family protein [Saccharopolyspora hirsuta]